MQNIQKTKLAKRFRRKARVRAKVFGTAKRPRLSIFRSLKGMSAQLIDDEKQKTLIGVNSREVKNLKSQKVEKTIKQKNNKTKKQKNNRKVEESFELGKLIAEKSKDKKIKECIFDKSSYKYHGRVKAFAEGAREGGLKF